MVNDPRGEGRQLLPTLLFVVMMTHPWYGFQNPEDTCHLLVPEDLEQTAHPLLPRLHYSVKNWRERYEPGSGFRQLRLNEKFTRLGD